MWFEKLVGTHFGRIPTFLKTSQDNLNMELNVQ